MLKYEMLSRTCDNLMRKKNVPDRRVWCFSLVVNDDSPVARDFVK